MARITIEDCMKQVPNRFQLVQMAAIRAKQLKRGATAFLDKDNNKEVVTALREIAAGIVKPDLSEVPDIDPLFVTRGVSAEPVVEKPVADAPGESVKLEASKPVQEPVSES
jgi:DNA-directed RNA polymerase subunit omega